MRGGQQLHISGHDIPLKVKAGLMYMDFFPMDKKIDKLLHVIMTGAGMRDPGAFDDSLSLDKHLDRIPTTAIDNNSRLYDCEGD